MQIKIRTDYEVDGKVTLSGCEVIEAQCGDYNRTFKVEPGAVDEPFELSIQIPLLLLLVIVARQDMAVRLGADVLQLKKDSPIRWTHQSGLQCPLTGDVSQALVTYAGSQPTLLEVRIAERAKPLAPPVPAADPSPLPALTISPAE